MPPGIYARKEFTEYFWNKVNKKEPNECWLWTGSKYVNGYGTIRREGKVVSAHRTSYDLHHPITKPIHEIELCVCHKCDNPACVNPNHLFLGTRSDNMKDCVNKERHAKVHGPSPFKGKPAEKLFGENHGSARLTETIVKEIREKYATGNYTYKQLLVEFGLKSEGHLGEILKRKIWSRI